MLRIDRPTTDHCSWKSLLGRTSNGHISVTVPDGRIRWSVTRQMATSVIDRYWILKSGNFYELRETISNNNLDASHYWYHRLNGSSSPVLTATSLSYGKAKNSTLHRIKTPWSDWDKIWHDWLRRRDDSSCKISCKSLQGGLPGKWVKYTQKFL